MILIAATWLLAPCKPDGNDLSCAMIRSGHAARLDLLDGERRFCR